MVEEEIKDNFVVGGKVKFKSGDEFEEHCFTGWMEEMRQHEGKEVTVCEINKFHMFRIAEDEGCIWYSEQQIEFKPEDKKEEEDIPKIVFKQDHKPTEKELNEMISKVNIDIFTKVIKSRLYEEMHSTERDELKNYNRAWAKDYLKEWARSKYRFYKLFGDKLTIDEEIEVDLDEHFFRTQIEEVKAKCPLYSIVLEGIGLSCIVENKMKKCECNHRLFEDTRVKTGMKFTKFISLFENKDLEMEVSKIYQTKGKTTLHISIDPVDYLTVSVNNSGWRSCHNFFNGEYKTAGLSYMFDETSLVAFTSTKEVEYNTQFPFKWNTKNWRQMVYISKESSSMAFSRQYPHNSEKVEKSVRHILEEIVSDFYGAENKWKLYSRQQKANISVDRGSCTLIYNDIGHGTNHKVVRNKQDANFKVYEDIIIGADVRSFRDDNVLDGGQDLW